MFKNEYTLNKPLITEYVYSVLCKNIIIYGSILAIFGFTIFIIIKEMAYLGLVMSILCLLIIAFCPLIMIRKLEESSKQLNNGTIEQTRITFSDNIIMEEGKVHLEFEYSQIKKIFKTKSFIVLMLKNNSAILVSKEGFINGTKEDFLQFIKDK